MFRTALIFMCLTISSACLGQVDCDKIKEENEYLKKTLRINTPIKVVTTSNIEFSLIECKGNKQSQEVVLQLILVNNNPDIEFQFSKANAIDVEGEGHMTYNLKIGVEGIRGKLYTGTPIKAKITFNKILPTTKILKVVGITHYIPAAAGRTQEFKFEDIAISWD